MNSAGVGELGGQKGAISPSSWSRRAKGMGLWETPIELSAFLMQECYLYGGT